MKIKKLARYLTIWLIGTILFSTIATAVWIGKGFYYLPDDMVAIVKTRSPYLFSPFEEEEIVVFGDNQIHWRPWGVTAIEGVPLPFHLPTFDQALADTVILNELYKEAMKGYKPPTSDKDLRRQVELVARFLNWRKDDYGWYIIHVPRQIKFERYEKQDNWILAGYYLGTLNADRSGLLLDKLSLNRNFKKGRPWAKSTYLGTAVHELHHAQGIPNMLYLWEKNRFLPGLLVRFDSMSEAVTQIRTAQITAELRRLNVPGYEAAFYDEMLAFSMRAAYFIMKRETAGYPWNAYPHFATFEDVWIIAQKFEEIGIELAETGRRPKTPACYCEEEILKGMTFLERLDWRINNRLKRYYTRDWEKRFWKVYMNLYPSTLEKRTLRRRFQLLREQNPYLWSAACYRYWYIPYLFYNISLSEEDEGWIRWYWTFYFGPFRVPFRRRQDVISASYFHREVQLRAADILKVGIWDRLRGQRDWVLAYYNVSRYDDEPFIDPLPASPEIDDVPDLPRPWVGK